MAYSDNYLLEEMSTLEAEGVELEMIALDDSLFDTVTIQRIKKRKSWIKERLREVKSALYPEVIA